VLHALPKVQCLDAFQGVIVCQVTSTSVLQARCCRFHYRAIAQQAVGYTAGSMAHRSVCLVCFLASIKLKLVYVPCCCVDCLYTAC